MPLLMAIKAILQPPHSTKTPMTTYPGKIKAVLELFGVRAWCWFLMKGRIVFFIPNRISANASNIE